MQLPDIENLARMARVDMPKEEMIEIGDSFDPILAYVGQIQEVSELSDDEAQYPLENVMRDDIVTNTPGQWTPDITAQMPASQDGFLKVKQIL